MTGDEMSRKDMAFNEGDLSGINDGISLRNGVVDAQIQIKDEDADCQGRRGLACLIVS